MKRTRWSLLSMAHFLDAVVRIRARVREPIVSLDVFNDPNHRLPERGQPVASGFSYENPLVLEEEG